MKKIFKILILCLGMLFFIGSLTACGNDEATQPETSEPNEEAVADDEPETPTGEPVANAEDLQADIVVIGAGGAGMAAALQAHQYGARNIVLVEKMPMVGGNTLLATGRMQAAGTSFQDEADGDSVDLYFDDVMSGGGYIADEELVRVLVDNSADALYWLNEHFDTNITDVSRGGGASAPRSHGATDEEGTVLPIGSVLVPALSQGLAEANIPVLLNTEVTELLVDEDGAVTGVVAKRDGENITINATSVILATGGFGANPEMIVRHDPSLEGFGTSNHVGALGSGITIAENINAGLVDMEHIQAHPTGHPEGTLLTEAMRGEGSILVNIEGERFVDELETRNVVADAILAQPEAHAYMIFDSRIRERLAIIETYISSGIIVQANSIEELAIELDIDPETFKATIERYNHYAAMEEEPDFNRTAPFVLEGDSFYAVTTIPVIHHTMGGVTINTDTHVLDTNGNIIQGLFAAGEVVGGIHGNNRLGGNAITDIIVFGRIAAAQAVERVQGTTGFTDPIDIASLVGEQGAATVNPGVQGDFTDGVFEGSAEGYGGVLTIRVVVEGGNIVEAYLLEHSETPIIYEAAEEGVINAIIATQNTDVDIVSGATLTSVGIMEAIEDALGLE